MKNQRILVTGGTGFVGSHVVERLISHTAQIITTARVKNPHAYFFKKNLDKKCAITFCDITDFNIVYDLITRYKITHIFHLAAQADVDVAFVNPFQTVSTNILGTLNILESARRCLWVKGVIVASSDKAYGKSKKTYTEKHPLAGDHPYEVSKSATDLLAITYWKTYGTPVVVTRFGNIYGPGDLNFNRIIPGIMEALTFKKTLQIRSDGTYVRDYVSVKDVAIAYEFLFNCLPRVHGEVFNISSADSYSVLDIITKSQKILKQKVLYKIKNTAKNEIPYQHLNYSKIKKLGWRPTHTLQSDLLETYEWYQDYFAQMSDKNLES